MRNSEDVTFAGGSLDRAAHMRGDTPAIDRMRRDPGSLAIVLWRGRPLIDFSGGTALAWLSPESAILACATGEPVFLGLQHGTPRFAYEIPDWPSRQETTAPARFFDDSRTSHPAAPADSRFADLRAVMSGLSRSDAGDAATAKGIFEWHKTHTYCANCGAKSFVSQAGWQRECPRCGYHHFPRTDPVVIMLVTSGNNVLLGRSPNWPAGMFSLLAGFMEPGETVEDAVRREVDEEVGIAIGRTGYLASQPWPFPSSLMIGCHAQALSTEITIDGKEIEAAKWVSREDLADAMAGTIPDLQPTRKGSIARFLLDRWLADTLGD